MSPTLEDVERMERRAWDEMGLQARVASDLLLKGHLNLARECAQQSATAGEWWREAAQQVRDVRRVSS